jgi:hypothetical protein
MNEASGHIPTILYSWEKNSRYTLGKGGCPGSSVSVDVVAKRNIPAPLGNQTPLVRALTQSLYLAIHAHVQYAIIYQPIIRPASGLLVRRIMTGSSYSVVAAALWEGGKVTHSN